MQERKKLPARPRITKPCSPGPAGSPPCQASCYSTPQGGGGSLSREARRSKGEEADKSPACASLSALHAPGSLPTVAPMWFRDPWEIPSQPGSLQPWPSPHCLTQAFVRTSLNSPSLPNTRTHTITYRRCTRDGERGRPHSLRGGRPALPASGIPAQTKAISGDLCL